MNISLREEIGTKFFGFYLTQADEAHRLSQRRNLSSYEFFDKTNEKLGLDKDKGTQLDWILNSAKHVILFYDHNQSVKPSDIDSSRFSELDANWFSLKTQMRVKAGSDYPVYIENVLKGCCANRAEFSGYELRLFDDVQLMIDAIKIKEGEFGLSESEMLNYIINIYKTLMTRGILGTYVYACDHALNDYLKLYF